MTKSLALIVLSTFLILTHSENTCSWTSIDAAQTVSYAPSIDEGGFLILVQEPMFYGLALHHYNSNGEVLEVYSIKRSLSSPATTSVLQMADGRISICYAVSGGFPYQILLNKDFEFIGENYVSEARYTECFRQASTYPGEIIMNLEYNIQSYFSFSIDGNVQLDGPNFQGISCADVKSYSGGYAYGYEGGIDLLRKRSNEEEPALVVQRTITTGSESSVCNFHVYRNGGEEKAVFLNYVDITNLEIKIFELDDKFEPITYSLPTDPARPDFASAINIARQTMLICIWNIKITCMYYSLLDGTKLAENKDFPITEEVYKLGLVPLGNGNFVLNMVDEAGSHFQIIDWNFNCGTSTSLFSCPVSPCRQCLIINEFTFCNSTESPDTCADGEYEDSEAGCLACSSGCLACTNNTDCSSCDQNLHLYNGSCYETCPLSTFSTTAPGFLSCEKVLIINTAFNATPDGIAISADVLSEDPTAHPTRTYRWEIDSTSNNETAITLLANFLNTQTGRTFTLEYKYLEPEVSYEIYSYFTSEVGTEVSNQTVIASIDFLSQPSIIKSISSMNREDNIKVLFKVSSAHSILNNNYILVPENNHYDFTTTEVDGGIEVSFDRCVLSSKPQSQITIQSHLSANSLFTSSQTINLEINDDTQTLLVTTLNRSHPFDSDIVLQARVITIGNCPPRKTAYTYFLTCEKSTDNGNSFSSCPDSNSLLSQPSENGILVIPSSYIAVDQQLRLNIEAKEGEDLAAKNSGFITITTDSALILTVSCIDMEECEKYTSNQELTLFVTPHRDPGVSLKYSWSNNLGVPMTSSGNSTRIKFDSSSFATEIIEVTVTIIESSFIGEGKIFLQLNRPPAYGTFTVTPTTWSTGSAECSLAASHFLDSDRSLRYQFFYTTLAGTIPLSGMLEEPLAQAKIYSQAPQENVVMTVKVFDRHGAFSTSLVEIGTKSLQSNIVNFFEEFVSEWPKIQSENVVGKALEAALIANRINSLESSLTSLFKNVTSCTKTSCSCVGFYGDLVSCSLDNITLNNYLSYKRDFLANLTEIYDELQKGPSESWKRLLNEDLVRIYDATIHEYQEMLASILTSLNFITAYPEISNQELLTDANIFLQNNQSSNISSSYRELQESAKSFSNIVEWMKLTDCKCVTDFCKKMPLDAGIILNKISSAGIKRLFLDQETFTHITPNFEITATKSRVCNLPSYSLQSSPQSPKITITKSQIPNQDCEKEITIQSYSFPNLFDCSRSTTFFGRNLAESKNTVMVKILDSDGQDIGNQITIQLEMPNGATCPSSCSTEGMICTCLASVLSIESQLNGLFTLSTSTESELDVSDLPSFALFWVVVGCLIFTIVMVGFFGIKKAASNFCIVEKFENRASNSKFRQCLYMYISVHEALSLYLVKDNLISKSYRFIVFYIKILFFVLYTIILAESSEDSNADSLIKNHLTAKLILLSYVTVLPVHHFILFLIRTEARSLRKEKTKTNFFLIVAILAGIICFNLSFYTVLRRGKNAQKVWGLNFVVTMIQELIINPIIFFIISYFLMKMNWCTSLGKITLVDEGFERIFNKDKKTHLPVAKKEKQAETVETERELKKRKSLSSKI